MKKNILKTFSSVFIITLISKVLGLLRDIVFANYYGTGFEATAFFTALKIPTQIVDLVLSSAIVSTFVPVFNEIMQKEGKEKANHFAGNFINVVGLIATVISIIGIVFAPQIVRLLAGGFDAQTYTLTVELIQITFPMIIFTALAFSFVGFLQSYGEFNVPAMISGVSNLVVIGFLLLFSNTTGIHGVAVCMVVAWLLQLLIQLPFAKKNGYKLSKIIDFKDPNLKKVFLLSIPILISTAVLPINNLVSTRLASGMGESAVAALEYAYKLYVVISGVFTYAVGNIIFPELSRASSDKNSVEFKDIISKAIRLLTFILIPLTLGIIVYRQDIVSVMYQRGEFDSTSTIETSGALLYYAIGIIGAGIVEVMNKSFYAKQDTKTPLKVGIGIVITNVLLSVLLGKTALSFNGLALATSITALLNALILTFLANKKEKGIINKELLFFVAKVAISALIMAIIVVLVNIGLKNILTGTLIKEILRMIIGAASGVIAYFVVTMLLKVNQFKELLKSKT